LGNLEALVIAGVDENSPADRAELRRGYIVRAIDGHVPHDLVQAAKLVYGKKRGETVRLTLLVFQARTGRILHASADVKAR
jgi:S1-C subfamily serine protease